MKIALTIVIVACLLTILVASLFRSRRERAWQANLDDHMRMLSEGIEKIAQKNPEIVNDLAVHPPSQTMRDLWGLSPSQETVLEEIRVADEVLLGWDYVVHIHEGAEQYLGTLQFQTLEERFAKIPGIQACKHEDRELFLVSTKKLSVKNLREAIWQEFLASAEASYSERREL